MFLRARCASLYLRQKEFAANIIKKTFEAVQRGGRPKFTGEGGKVEVCGKSIGDVNEAQSGEFWWGVLFRS